MRRMEKEFTVATFVHNRGPGRKPLVTAYTRDFNPSWEGCKLYEVYADSGTEAKKIAIACRKNDEGLKP